MARKKWTRNLEESETAVKFRQKRKWQVALRRYILEKNISANYAFYFGLDIERFRKWIEIQFTEGLTWENFGSAWQIEHIVPVAYFDFSVNEDLILCWNFINIRVDIITVNTNQTSRIDIMAVKSYFAALYTKTGYSICQKMLNKIALFEKSKAVIEPAIEGFIIEHREQLETLSTFSKDEFNRLNQGIGFNDILLERAIFKKYG